MEDTISSEEDKLDPIEVETIQKWAKINFKKDVLQRRMVRMQNTRQRNQQVNQGNQQGNNQPPVQNQPVDPLAGPRQQVKDSTAFLNPQGVTPTGRRFAETVGQMRGRFGDSSISALKGRSDTLANEEKNLKDSSRFVDMMKLLREYEVEAKKDGSRLSTTSVKRDALKIAAQSVVDHFRDKYKSDQPKNATTSHGKGFAAAQQILNDITTAENARRDAMLNAKNLIDEFQKQLDTSKQGGASVDRMSMMALENLVTLPEIPAEVEFVAKKLVTEARKVEADKIDQLIGNPPDTLRKEKFQAKGQLCVELGSCNPPKGTDSGASDSFFLKNQNGQMSYIFKPLQGEADQSQFGWEKGGAAPRELLASSLNDQLSALGLDCGISKTALVTLDNPVLGNGKSSKATKRTGALQEFAKNDGSVYRFLGAPDITTPDEDQDKFCSDPQEIAARKQKINKDDLQKIALFDFMTINLDRSPANMLMRKEGQPPNDTVRLIPIDGGNLLPCRNALQMGANGMAPVEIAPDQPLTDGNGLMQLPQATEDFSLALQQQIDLLDPAALSNNLRNTCQQNEQQEQAFQGGVKPEVFDMMKLSTQILKRACGTQANPRLTPADMAALYQSELSNFMTFALGPSNPQPNSPPFNPPDQNAINQEIDRLIAQQDQRKQAAALLKQKTQQFNQLGGQKRLTDLGWPAALAKTDIDLAIDHVTKGTEEPNALDTYNKAGGDVLLAQLNAKADLSLPVKLRGELLELAKIEDGFIQNGGDLKFVELCNRFEPIFNVQAEKKKVWNKRLEEVPKEQKANWKTLSGNEEPTPLDTKFFKNNFELGRVVKSEMRMKAQYLEDLKHFFNE